MRGVATSKRELPPQLREFVSTAANEGDLRKLLGRMTPGQRRAMWLGAFIAIGHTSIADALRAWVHANQLAPLDPHAEMAGAPPAQVVPIRQPRTPAARQEADAATVERDARIVQLVAEGNSQADVARSLGLTSQRVGQVVRKHRSMVGA